MTSELGASTTEAALALTAFWAMVTVGRVVFAALQRRVPPRVTYHVLPFLLAGAFVLIALLPDDAPAAGVLAFGLAGLACSALLPLTISFGQKELPSVSAAVAGGVIAFYQLGYGIAAFGVGPLLDNGVELPTIYGFAALVAAAMGLWSFVVARRLRHPPSARCRGRACSLPPASRSRSPTATSARSSSRWAAVCGPTPRPAGSCSTAMRRTGRSPRAAGQVLIPWPNRIEDGAYEFDGRRHQLPLDELEARNAIHGLVRWAGWRVGEREQSRVVMEHVLHPQPGLSVLARASASSTRSPTTACRSRRRPPTSAPIRARTAAAPIRT